MEAQYRRCSQSMSVIRAINRIIARSIIIFLHNIICLVHLIIFLGFQSLIIILTMRSYVSMTWSARDHIERTQYKGACEKGRVGHQ